MITIFAETKWSMIGNTATSVGTTWINITWIFTLVVVTALGWGTVSISTAASNAEVLMTQETFRAVTVFGTLCTAIVVAAHLPTIALSIGSTSLDTEATLT